MEEMVAAREPPPNQHNTVYEITSPKSSSNRVSVLFSNGSPVHCIYHQLLWSLAMLLLVRIYLATVRWTGCCEHKVLVDGKAAPKRLPRVGRINAVNNDQPALYLYVKINR